MRSPIWAVEQPRSRSSDLSDTGAIGIRGEDALATTEKHAKDDAGAVRGPIRPESKVTSCDPLQVDRCEIAAVRTDREYLAIPNLPDDKFPIRREVCRIRRESKSPLTSRRKLTKS